MPRKTNPARKVDSKFARRRALRKLRERGPVLKNRGRRRRGGEPEEISEIPYVA